MQVIEQSHQLLHDQDDLIQQIGSRAAICYKTDGDNPEANRKRVQHCLKNGHMSALEMGRVCFKANEDNYYSELKFIELGKTGDFMSSSIRGWIEIGDTFESILTAYRTYSMECPSDHPDYIYHKYQAVKFITNRAMSHELVRHRPCSFLQESQRYVRYDKPGGIEFIKPLWFEDERVGLFSMERAADKYYSQKEMQTPEFTWMKSMSECENHYKNLLDFKLKPQQARGVLPNDTKTEIIMYASLAEWRHIFYQRTQGGADPMMKALMRPVLEEFRVLYPGVFDELKPSVAGR